MERLTIKGKTRYICNAPDEFCEKHRTEKGIVYCCSCERRKQMQNKLGEYEDLEEQGLLLKLPCKVWDEVWRISTQHDNYDGRPYKIVTRTTFRLDMLDCVGKTVYLTKAEAEKALEEMEKK